MIENKFNHRTEIKPTKVDMRAVKDILFKILGYIPVFHFLVVLYGNGEYTGPYNEVDRGLLLLYQIVSSETGIDMSEFIPYTKSFGYVKVM